MHTLIYYDICDNFENKSILFTNNLTVGKVTIQLQVVLHVVLIYKSFYFKIQNNVA